MTVDGKPEPSQVPMRYPPPELDETAAQRLWGKVTKTADCWIWAGYRNQAGYGIIQARLGGPRTRAHRVAYALSGGVFTGDGLIRHRCDNPPCVRPDHLLCGTIGDNVADMVERDRQASGDRSGYRKHPESYLNRPPVQGVKHGCATFTEAEVLAIRAAHDRGESQSSIARRIGRPRRTVALIASRKTWRHLP
ncbi:HNH endonuclease [Micromonospora chalcea]|uniref:HNH endonuclease n=1 Tax=Micromonospora chalcea TaxID=1874 RepID=UPI0038152858